MWRCHDRLSEGVGKFDKEINSVNYGHPPSSVALAEAANAQNEGTVMKSVLRSTSLSGPNEQGRAAVVNCTPGKLEWEDVPGCEPRPGDLLRCLTKGMRTSMWVGEDSGFMERGGEHLAHKCIGTSSCKLSI